MASRREFVEQAQQDRSTTALNPKKLGKIDNHRQEPWKAPLPQFIEHLYAKRFGRERPEVVVSIEERVRQAAQKRAQRKAARANPEVPGE